MKLVGIGLAVILIISAVVISFNRTEDTNTSPPAGNLNRSTSVACPQADIQTHVAAADLIITGQVFMVIPGGELARVIINPDQVFKGRSGPSVTIMAKPQTAGKKTYSGSADELHFSSDQPPFLLFLQAQPDGTYQVPPCSGSRRLGSGLTESERLFFGSSALIES